MTSTPTIRQQLVESFCCLLQDTPYQKLSVEAICKAVPTSRRTFYNYFSSKENLAVDTVFESLSREFHHSAEDRCRENTMLCFFQAVYDQPAFYKALYEVDEGVFLCRCFLHALVDVNDSIESSLEMPGNGKPAHSPCLPRHFTQAGLASVMMHWVRTGMINPPAVMARDVSRILENPLGTLKASLEVSPQAV